MAVESGDSREAQPASSHSKQGALERVLRRDRLVVSIPLVLLTGLAWVVMTGMARDGTIGEKTILPCCGARFGVTFAMWVVMMAAMMTPSVAPMVLTHAAILRRRVAHGTSLLSFATSVSFLLGYLLAWTGFSFCAALAQSVLYRHALLDPQTLAVAPWAGGILLLVAGAFQVSPAKNACLSQCRAPMGYFLTEWREGCLGSVSMGLHHGFYCVGCCWMLMAILFAVGVMNVLWGSLITVFVMAEKVLPWHKAVVRLGAASCMLGGAALLCRAGLELRGAVR
jgi:predicted metal-binding membrane protein